MISAQDRLNHGCGNPGYGGQVALPSALSCQNLGMLIESPYGPFVCITNTAITYHIFPTILVPAWTPTLPCSAPTKTASQSWILTRPWQLSDQHLLPPACGLITWLLCSYHPAPTILCLLPHSFCSQLTLCQPQVHRASHTGPHWLHLHHCESERVRQLHPSAKAHTTHTISI